MTDSLRASWIIAGNTVRELVRSKICGNTWAHPALAGGRLYIRDKSDLVCVQLP